MSFNFIMAERTVDNAVFHLFATLTASIAVVVDSSIFLDDIDILGFIGAAKLVSVNKPRTNEIDAAKICFVVIVTA